MKNYKILFTLFLLLSESLLADVEVKYFNERFTWIEVPSKFVKARLNLPVEGYSVCWIEVKTPKKSFDFIVRRGLPYSSCLYYVSEIRKLIKNNETLEIVGMIASKDGPNEFHALWEMIRGEKGCVGYFGDCENFEKNYPEWEDWKSKPIDPLLYP